VLEILEEYACLFYVVTPITFLGLYILSVLALGGDKIVKPTNSSQ
jgi:hypothetical protein